MCGRYALFGPEESWKRFFGIDDWPQFGDNYNIAPSLEVPVVRQSPAGERVAGLLRWGLVPNWSRDPAVGARLNNARGESLRDKPSFRDAWERRRCLVPASGFYEWHADGRIRQPYYISSRAGEPLALGGLWESWRTPEGGLLRSFCVITTGPNAVMRPIHERMPVIVGARDWARWLDPGTGSVGVADLVEPCDPDWLAAWPVDRGVSRGASAGPGLIQPLADMEPASITP